MDIPYTTTTEVPTMYTSEEIIFVVLYLIVYFFMMAYGIFTYVGMSLGGFRMGRKAGMSNPWMFWVPGCNIYAMGDLADHQTAANEGKSTAYRNNLDCVNLEVHSLPLN